MPVSLPHRRKSKIFVVRECDICADGPTVEVRTKHDKVVWNLCLKCALVWKVENVAVALSKYTKAINSREWTIVRRQFAWEFLRRSVR